jgi:hypothetical protein
MAVLSSYITSKPNSPLGETCYVALEGLKRQRARVCACQYRSFDPAIGDPDASAADIPRYAAILANQKEELYQVPPVPSTLNPQPSTLNPPPQMEELYQVPPVPSTLNPQPSTLHPKRRSCTRCRPYPQPSTLYPQPSTPNGGAVPGAACTPPNPSLCPSCIPLSGERG